MKLNDIIKNNETKPNENKTNEDIENNILDLLPPKYERIDKKDLMIKYITFVVLGLDGFIFFGNIQFFFSFKKPLEMINFFCVILFFILIISWLHYKLQHLITGTYKIFMDLNILQRNSKYYSGLEIPDRFIKKAYPDITIQIPVYKEDLENTIRPTIMSAMEQANRYNLETGARCNIIVCDDGFTLISESEQKERVKFYSEHHIGYTARPHPSKYKRNGRFKKAGNLNFSMNYSEVALQIYKSDETALLDKSKNNNNLLKAEFLRLFKMGAVFKGDIRYGSYIFLIDSDTRLPEFPKEENGCLKRLIKDILFDGEDTVLYMQCFTSPYLSTKSLSEKCVFHSTCHIYNGILVGTSMNSMAPLVGHNALLNKNILKEIAHVDEETQYNYYWDENRISEDFDCMMRGCEKGYIGRYVVSSGIFFEGVSFNYVTEYFKLSKFACGAAELTFNPANKWFAKGGGIFSSDIIGFIGCKEIEWYNKISILAYILNFIAIAQAHVAMFYNLIFFEELLKILPFVLLPVNLMWEGMLAWGIINTTTNILFSFRVNFNTYLVLRQQWRETFFTSALYGSLSVRFFIMYMTHLFNLNISFGATQKNDESITIRDWVYSTKYECMIYTFYLVCILVRIFLFPIKGIYHTFYFGCLPLFMNIFWFWFGPIIFDILPRKKDKTKTESYKTDEKMFHDKYLTQIPKSEVFLHHHCKKMRFCEEKPNEEEKHHVQVNLFLDASINNITDITTITNEI